MCGSIDFCLSIGLRFNWSCCQLIWDSSDAVASWFQIQMSAVVSWFALPVIWLSVGLRFNWFRCQMVWDSSDAVVNWCVIQMILVVNWFEIQLIRLSNDLRFKRFGCQMVWDSSGSGISFSARLPSEMKLWSSKTKLFCETSFRNEALKLKTEVFLRDFLQKSSFEAQKQNFFTRFPSKMKFWSSKRKRFCETSFKNDMLTRRLTSELQYSRRPAVRIWKHWFSRVITSVPVTLVNHILRALWILGAPSCIF